jgi:hypothetical protein
VLDMEQLEGFGGRISAKRKKQLQTEQKKRQKLESNSAHVRVEDFFQKPFSPDMVEMLKPYFQVLPGVTMDTLRHHYSQVDIPPDLRHTVAALSGSARMTVENEELDEAPEMGKVIQFLQLAQTCQQWLNRAFQSIGWSNNFTGYDPIGQSQTEGELIDGVAECWKLGCKQAWQMHYAFQRELQLKGLPRVMSDRS